ncbi:hypothetical protein DdX_20015 [Ditylenchus destructor]|uniref:Protein kinase domain-containing protein n=1 Tax=Ditylenchus destructor TaxID=166010 RepID=A0AAD4MIF0_9BILA|nr:hypothetical protein DdX_20015 [Ditylenchus destructor]
MPIRNDPRRCPRLFLLSIVGITRDLLNGLQALHEEVICHNDVNDENVMIYDDDDSAASIKVFLLTIQTTRSYLLATRRATCIQQDNHIKNISILGPTAPNMKYTRVHGADLKFRAVNTSVWVTKQQVDYHAFGMLTYQICCNTLPCHEIDDLDLTSLYNIGRICDEIQDFFIRE